MSVGRNAPCPCGSGKKYKKCCLKSDEQSRLAERKTDLDGPFGEIRSGMRFEDIAEDRCTGSFVTPYVVLSLSARAFSESAPGRL